MVGHPQFNKLALVHGEWFVVVSGATVDEPRVRATASGEGDVNGDVGGTLREREPWGVRCRSET